MDKKFIPFGAQYYRAPVPFPEDWEKDLKNFREAGFNTIKFWVQWRWNNPKENVYYFEDMDRLMDIAYENKLNVILNTILEVAPAWFYKKHPESLMIMADGRKIKPQTKIKVIGGSPGPCFHHEKGIYYKKAFLREVVKRYSGHPALYMWDLWNEPELTCSIARKPVQEDMVCYCENSLHAFAEWLKQKYGDIGVLNKTWNKNYTSWEEIEAPICGHAFNNMVDWRVFFSQTVINELRMRVDVTRKYDKIHPVMTHTVPIPYFNAINACCDDYGLAKLCDMFGDSSGPENKPFTSALTTSSAPGKVTISSEIHVTGGTPYYRAGIPSFEDMKSCILIPLARGMKGFLFWQYRAEISGRTSPAFGLTSLDGEKTEWLEHIIKVNNTIQKYSDIIGKVKPVPAEIAVINGQKNQIFDWCVSDSIERHYYSLSGTFSAMYDGNYNADIIGTEQLINEDISRYRVIYYPFPYYMEEGVAEALENWVKNGGTLISEAFFGGIKHENSMHSTTMPGYGFDKVFGVREGITLTASSFMDAYGWHGDKEHKDDNVKLIMEKDFEHISSGDVSKSYFFQEELIPLDAEVLARFENGKAAVTCAEYGNGKAIMIGSLPGYVYGKERSADVMRLITSLVAMGGVQPFIETDSTDVRADLLTDGSKKCVMVVVNEGGKECEVDIGISRKAADRIELVDMFTGKQLIPYNEKDELKCHLRLKPFDSNIYSGYYQKL